MLLQTEALVRAALDFHVRRGGDGVMVTTFHGGEPDQRAFLSAIEHNCSCEYNEAGALARQCLLHNAFLNDQHWIDHQEFGRFLRAQMLREEWRGPAEP